MEKTMTDIELRDLIDFLGDMSIEGETFDICLAALKLQVALKDYYKADLL
jgi:hypothetical protein